MYYKYDFCKFLRYDLFFLLRKKKEDRIMFIRLVLMVNVVYREFLVRYEKKKDFIFSMVFYLFFIYIICYLNIIILKFILCIIFFIVILNYIVVLYD